MTLQHPAAPSASRPAPRIAITVGEPAGIGPDLIAQIAQQPSVAERVVIGDPEVLQARAEQLGLPLRLLMTETPGEPAATPPGTLQCFPVPVRSPVTPGVLNPNNAEHVLDVLAHAADGALQGVFDAIVTGPVHKGVIHHAGYPFSGHTEWFAERAGSGRPVMLLVAGTLRVALVTTHLPLRAVPDSITRDRLEHSLRVLEHHLRRFFGLERPSIQVCGLNPHAGEQGTLGGEEIAVIQPVLERLRAEGMDLQGPVPADTAFTPQALDRCDAVLAMYHDQGLAVLKHVGFGNAVNLTLGLPFVRTSVDHGTALSLAGSGLADAGSLRAAEQLALQILQQQSLQHG